MNLMTLDEIRQVLERQNMSPECTQAQREANAWRLYLYELLSKGKAPYEPRPTLDTIFEKLVNGVTYTSNKLLKDDE